MRLVILFLAGLAVAAGANEHPAQVAGIYEGTVAVKNGDGRKITLNLHQDGASEFEDNGKKSRGAWSVTGSELRVTADAKSTPLLWRVKKNAIVLQSPEQAGYGKKGVVLRKPR